MNSGVEIEEDEKKKEFWKREKERKKEERREKKEAREKKKWECFDEKYGKKQGLVDG